MKDFVIVIGNRKVLEGKVDDDWDINDFLVVLKDENEVVGVK